MIQDGPDKPEIDNNLSPDNTFETSENVVIEENAENVVVDDKTSDHHNSVAKKHRKNLWGILLLVLLCGAGIVVMLKLADSFSQGDSATFVDILKTMDYGYFGLAIGVLALMMVTDILKFLVIGHATTGRARLATCAKVTFLGKYYDNITPFAVGGQPFQIAYLNQKGYTGGQSSAIVLIRYFVQMICWLTVAFVIMVSNSSVLSGMGAIAVTIKIGAWIGFVANSIPAVFVLLFCLVPNFADKLLCGVVSLGFKLKIVKNKQKQIDKAHKIAKDFVGCFKLLSKTPLHFVIVLLLCIVEPLITLSFPYFLVVSMAGQAPSIDLWFTVITLNMFAMYSVAIFPTPGNSGFFETTFSLVFSGVATNVLFWVTLSWRFFTYYIYILIGIILSVYAAIRSGVRASRAKKLIQKNE